MVLNNKFSKFSHIVFETTYRCNLFCGRCYVSSSKEFKDPDFNITLQIIQRLKELDTEEVLLCGGEPTVSKYLETLLDYCKLICLPVSISTNGIVNSKQARFISQFCSEVDVSIRSRNVEIFEGITSIPGSFKYMRKGLGYLANTNLTININYDLMKENWQDFYETISELTKEGIKIKKVWVQRISIRGRAQNVSAYQEDSLHIPEYISVLSQMEALNSEYQIKCRLIDPLPLCLIPNEFHNLIMESKYGYEWGCVNPEGVLRRDPVDPLSDLVSIFSDDVIDLWNGDAALTHFRSLNWLPNICRECKLKKKCKGGFSSSAKVEKGSLYSFLPDIFLTTNADQIHPF